MRTYLIIGTILSVLGYVGYLKLSNTYLERKVEKAEAQIKHDVAEAHIEEIDLTLAERLKNIEEKYNEPVEIEAADDNGSWVDDFGM